MNDSLNEVQQPINLEDCFTILDKVLTDKFVFKTTLEENACAMAHHSLGRWLRNSWYLWWTPALAEEYKENNYPQTIPSIVKYFNDTHKLFNGDDMSGMIVQSYHRYLNGKELKLEEQVKKYHDHWANG